MTPAFTMCTRKDVAIHFFGGQRAQDVIAGDKRIHFCTRDHIPGSQQYYSLCLGMTKQV